MKTTAKLAFGLLGVVTIAFFWPIFTPVSGQTMIVIQKGDGAPVVGVDIRQFWGVYGWGGFGGGASATTDSAGMTSFPPRKSIGFVGIRLLRQMNASLTKLGGNIFFEGQFGSAYTHRWGPIVSFEVDLPAGFWLPAAWPQARTPADDLIFPSVGDTRRYSKIGNLDPLHPKAYISGDALGFIGDTEVILRIRSATPEEEIFIQENRMRQDLVAWSQKQK